MAHFDHPWVDGDVGVMEDAALLRPETGPRLVFTVDFITPVVDEPELFGAIAAANALSDIYAMGGEPQVALAVCGFPDDKLSPDILARILEGGRRKAAEAGCAVVGGHTVLDPELKYGLCVLGTVEAELALVQTRARAGDHLVLTKPLGFGIAAQAIKKGRLPPADLERVVAGMCALNRGAKNAALAAGVRAATDVTGFGLLGHLHNLARSSGLSARLFAGAVPRFEFAAPLAAAGLVPGGSQGNLRFVADFAHFDPAVGEVERSILTDPQTSGGLLIAIPPERAPELVAKLEAEGTLAQAVIGELTAGEAGHLEVVAGALG